MKSHSARSWALGETGQQDAKLSTDSEESWCELSHPPDGRAIRSGAFQPVMGVTVSRSRPPKEAAQLPRAPVAPAPTILPIPCQLTPRASWEVAQNPETEQGKPHPGDCGVCMLHWAHTADSGEGHPPRGHSWWLGGFMYKGWVSGSRPFPTSSNAPNSLHHYLVTASH